MRERERFTHNAPSLGHGRSFESSGGAAQRTLPSLVLYEAGTTSASTSSISKVLVTRRSRVLPPSLSSERDEFALAS